MAYTIKFAAAVESHLKSLSSRERRVVLDSIERQLTLQPTLKTRNRKPMRPNFLAAWELRLGNLRVYYRVTEPPNQLVQIAAVGIKKREQIWIGGERVEL